jgi:DNA repair protein RadD
MSELWPHQRRAIEAARVAWREGARAIAICAPTGAGKTRIASALAAGHLAKGGRRVLAVAHRVELVSQLARALIEAGSGAIRTIAADRDDGPNDAPVAVASLQTLIARDDWPDASMLLLDEAHHFSADAPVWLAAAQRYASLPRLGLTATPVPEMGALFDHLVIAAQPAELVAAGVLVPITALAPSKPVDGANVGSPLEQYRKHTPSGRAIVFCQNRPHARQVAEEFRAAGIACESIDGDTDGAVRKDVVVRFNRGDLRVVTNVFVLTEGFDSPPADTCIVARGVSSATMWIQMIGRVRRRHPGKRSATLIDMRGHVHRFGMPDDPRSYSLDADAKVAEKLPPLAQCRACGAVYRYRPSCLRCGATLPPPPLPREQRGELAAIFATESAERRRAYLHRLVEEARSKNYGRGWAQIKFKSKYGCWPNKELYQ